MGETLPLFTPLFNKSVQIVLAQSCNVPFVQF